MIVEIALVLCTSVNLSMLTLNQSVVIVSTHQALKACKGNSFEICLRSFKVLSSRFCGPYVGTFLKRALMIVCSTWQKLR